MAIVRDKSGNNPYLDSHIDPPYVVTRHGRTTSTDRSIVADTTSKVAAAANSRRQSIEFRNDSAVDVYINFNGVATAVAGGGNIKIAANGGTYTSRDQDAVQIIAASATAAVTITEFV